MEDYGLVSSDPPWRWVVEKPCFVSWNSKEEGLSCLGQLSPLNSTSKLTINIGWRPENNELLIALHLPISIRASKHPRGFFMIIPCTFDTSSIDMTFGPVQSDGRVDLEGAGLADCNLFHIPIALDMPCDVIMPQSKRQKPVKGTPKELMTRLKSLSETCSFDIYFRFDTFAQLELRRIFARIDEHQLETPVLLLDSMYDGRGAGINLWLNQGLDIVPHEDPRPPPYTSHTTPPLVEIQVPYSDAAIPALPIYQENDNEGVPETPFWVRMRRMLDYRSPSIECYKGDTFKRAASVGSLPDARQEKRKRLCRSPLLGPLIRGTPAPVFESEKATIDAHHDANSPRESIGEIASTQLKDREAADPLAVELNQTTSVTPRDIFSLEDRADEIANWLYSAWNILPSAHHDLRSHLLALGAASNEDMFPQARVECSTRLAFTVARDQTAVAMTVRLTNTTDAENQVREVVQWINGVRFDADVILMNDLVALARAAMEVVDSASDDKAMKMNNFLMCKAKCIASACLLRNVATAG
ncbi:unnamed protein product [Aureobasidium vineae]|uniref:Uncharacterized protein n=1 Tax=Aureobasidium vineae TaxID=2773715 RepID=A0A9N8PHB2_9PEZI|nr:unnamed protein product [Aureobasidium vineae]